MFSLYFHFLAVCSAFLFRDPDLVNDRDDHDDGGGDANSGKLTAIQNTLNLIKCGG